jgi:hypothetical protein
METPNQCRCGYFRPANPERKAEVMSNMSRCKHGLIEGQCGICQAMLARSCKPKQEEPEKKKPARKAKPSQ